MSNAIAISRDLVAAGFTQKQAEAVVQAVITHTSENQAAKDDIAKSQIKIARINGKSDKLDILITMLMGVTLGLYVAIATLHIAGFPTP